MNRPDTLILAVVELRSRLYGADQHTIDAVLYRLAAAMFDRLAVTVTTEQAA